jgi:hypothetical protein
MHQLLTNQPSKLFISFQASTFFKKNLQLLPEPYWLVLAINEQAINERKVNFLDFQNQTSQTCSFQIGVLKLRRNLQS